MPYVQVLSRMNKANCLLLGEPGVGKTAVVEALAQRVVDVSKREAVKREAKGKKQRKNSHRNALLTYAWPPRQPRQASTDRTERRGASLIECSIISLSSFLHVISCEGAEVFIRLQMRRSSSLPYLSSR